MLRGGRLWERVDRFGLICNLCAKSAPVGRGVEGVMSFARVRRGVLRSLGGVLLVALGAATMPGAARADKNWDDAQDAFAICVDNFPRTQDIHAALAAAGWRYDGNVEGLKIFTRNGFRAIAATQGNSQMASRCVVSSSRLSPEAAGAFARQIAAKLDKARQIDLSDRGASVAWEGVLRGKTLRLGVVPDGEFGVMRGAIVVLGEL